jgi:hypothetical protein
MVAFHLCIQSDGRIVLDREIQGELVKTIEVADPPLKWRWLDDEWQQVPEYRCAYEAARGKVDDSKFNYVDGQGWYMPEDGRDGGA